MAPDPFHFLETLSQTRVLLLIEADFGTIFSNSTITANPSGVCG